MMKRTLIVFLLAPFIISRAQNLDSLFNEYVKIRGLSVPGYPRVTVSGKPVKCAFDVVAEVKLNYDRFNIKQKAVIAGTLDRPAADTSFVSPSGKFRIHYYKSGNNAPKYDLNEFAKAADSSYNYEVNILGYPAPPSDNGAGGDNLYDIYIKNEGGGEYGGTTPEQMITDSTWTSFMDLDNDFGSEYYTHGIDAARVTVAHEFHHAIQIGNYIYRPTDKFYHELTSTSMEEFVFNSVNDYYNYLGEYFNNPVNSFPSHTGYDLAIWNFFLVSRFDSTSVPENVRGKNIIRRTWQLMPKERALQAIADAIQEAGSNFRSEFSTFALWTYFTNYRAVAGKYFKEAANYPLLTPLMRLSFTKPTTTLNISSEAVSNIFLFFGDNKSNPADTLVSIISNSDIAGALSTIPRETSFTYNLSTQAFNGSRQITDGYYSQIQSANDYLFSESNIYNGIPINGISMVDIGYAFPQPFSYSRNRMLNFPALSTGSGYGEIYIYNINMELVYSSQSRIIATDKIVMQWNGIDSKGKKLGTGVYIYITKCGDNIKKGKFVIYND